MQNLITNIYLKLRSLIDGKDSSTNALSTIDYAHKELHSGDHYTLTYVDSDLDSTDDIEILRTTPDTTKWSHFTFETSGILSLDVDFYEGTTLTGGTALTPKNNNRNSSNTSGLTITHTPTGSGDGTMLSNFVFGGDSSAQFKGSTAVSGDRNEWVLKQNTKYLLRATSGADNNRVSIKMTWYEHTNS